MDPSANAATAANADPLVGEILEVFAREARIDRQLLQLDARAEDLGAASLDVALAIFELEDRFGIRLPELPPEAPAPTVGELVQQVLHEIAQGKAGQQALATAGAAQQLAGASPGSAASHSDGALASTAGGPSSGLTGGSFSNPAIAASSPT